jgi:hypothetical protein
VFLNLENFLNINLKTTVKNIEFVFSSTIEVTWFFSAVIGIFFVFLVAQVKSTNVTEIIDPFEADEDLRYAADAFCREYT